MIGYSAIENVPHKAGVYFFKKNGEFIYIGKAKDLKKRLASHFKAKEGKSKLIVHEADNVEIIILENEKESLILEANMIFEYKPKYNALLKDTQVYPYIRISEDELPYVEIVRSRKGKGIFYGPFTNVYFTRQLFETLRKAYKFRVCKRDLSKATKPCMDYHLGLCSGICARIESKEDYARRIEELKVVLSGKFAKVVEFVKDKMQQHARLLDFENAAKYRDILLNFNKVLESQGVVLPENVNLDAVVGKHKTFLIFKIRSGYLISKLTYEYDGEIDEFVEKFYVKNSTDLPEKLLVERKTKQLANLAKILDIRIEKPENDLEKNLLEKAIDNLNYEIGLLISNRTILKQMKEILKLSKLPNTIEGIDISHLAGKNTVASLVVFENGEIRKDEYRKYKLGDILDDFESIRMLVRKRYSKRELPDLIFVDGGIGQVNAVYEALSEFGKECDVVGLAKEEEIIFTRDKYVKLAYDHSVLRLLVKIRDETHRVANEFTRKLSTKKSLRSVLDEVKWIGPKRKKLLLEHFKSVDEILRTPKYEIEQLIGKKATESLLSELSCIITI